MRKLVGQLKWPKLLQGCQRLRFDDLEGADVATLARLRQFNVELLSWQNVIEPLANLVNSLPSLRLLQMTMFSWSAQLEQLFCAVTNRDLALHLNCSLPKNPDSLNRFMDADSELIEINK